MDPNNQPGPPPQAQPQQPGQPAQYDFITNPGKPPKRSLFSFGRGNKNGLLVMIAGGLGLLTVILLLGSLFFGGSSDKQTLLNLAKKQSEVISVAELGVQDGGTSQAQSLALAVKLAITTQQQALLAQIAKSDKVKDKEYAAGISSDVAKTLETAQSNGRFDEAFANAIKQELTEYQQQLQSANAVIKTKSTKALLAEDFQGAELLLSTPSI